MLPTSVGLKSVGFWAEPTWPITSMKPCHVRYAPASVPGSGELMEPPSQSGSDRVVLLLAVRDKRVVVAFPHVSV